ncbi:MAG: aminodeoxychorismate synthase, component I [Lysobacteraceae bacterium]|nr:MAG: aminodeoxychorismate synthase, component I [Xanthomonadaceae bacterium]
MHVRELTQAFDLLDVHRLDPARYPVLLESSATGAHGRWDMLLAHGGEAFALRPDGVVRDAHGARIEGRFLDVLDAQWRAHRIERAAGAALPFRGGWALLLGYELAGQVEPVLRLPEWRAPDRVEEDAPQAYLDGVARVLDFLAAGDVFQVNLSRGWQAHFDAPLEPPALFQRLRGNNPAPFAGIFRTDAGSVVSASPERLVSVQGRSVATRPIAGTRPRLEGEDDAARIRELVGHPKERAEHVMLIDLERNDLGRVCTPGSVVVDELMIVESYAHVHHIVSNVRGELREGIMPGEVIAAVFPGGTITGCPKVRCMQVVAELEGVGRGAYTGAMGWLNRDGDMDLNILIRSAEVEPGSPDGSLLRFRTGAGIVIDSEPRRELDETRAKARGMLRALGVE